MRHSTKSFLNRILPEKWCLGYKILSTQCTIQIHIVTTNIHCSRKYAHPKLWMRMKHKKCSKRVLYFILIRNKSDSYWVFISYASYFCGFTHHLNYIFGNLIACILASVEYLLNPFVLGVLLCVFAFSVPCVQ